MFEDVSLLIQKASSVLGISVGIPDIKTRVGGGVRLRWPWWLGTVTDIFSYYWLKSQIHSTTAAQKN